MRPGRAQFRDPVVDNPSVVHLLFSFVMAASGYCQLFGQRTAENVVFKDN
jgi:hypothetical protein